MNSAENSVVESDLLDALWEVSHPEEPSFHPVFAGSSDDSALTVTVTNIVRANGSERWYDPITGRWLSNDPIGISGGLNQYCFVGNSPVNFRDPFGLCKVDQSENGGITTSTLLNGAGIALTDVQYSSKGMTISSKLKFYYKFYGNKSVSVAKVSSLAKNAAPPLAALATFVDYNEWKSGKMSSIQFWANSGATTIGIFGGKFGAAFGVGYGSGSILYAIWPKSAVNNCPVPFDSGSMSEPTMNVDYPQPNELNGERFTEPSMIGE